MKFWTRALLELEKSPQKFESILGVISKNFADNVFSESIVNNKIEKLTYKEMIDTAKSICSGVTCVGSGKINKGSFVGVLMKNSPLFVSAFWGVLMSGYKPVLLSSRASSETINEISTMTGCKLVIADQNHIFSNNANIEYIGVNELVNVSHNPKDVNWADEIALHTSGTTGSPKVAIYNGESICTIVSIAGEIIENDSTIRNGRNVYVRQLAFLPFYHIFGLVASLLWFSFFGRTFIFLPSYDSAGIEFSCKRLGVTHFFAVPLVWKSVTNSILAEAKKQGKEKVFWKAIRFSNWLQTMFPKFGKFVARKVLFASIRQRALGKSLVYLISGGGAIDRETLTILNGLGYSIHNGYGMTETGIVCVELSKRAKTRNTDSVGKAFSLIDCKLDDEGVLYVRSKSLCSAIIENGIRVERSINDWFMTRDVFEISNKNKLTAVSRIDDCIVGSNGENIYPEMVEKHYSIKGTEVCALGVGEKGSADYINLFVRFDDTLDLNARQQICNEFKSITDTLPFELKPVKIMAVKEFAYTDIGKVKRANLKQLFIEEKLEYAYITNNSSTTSFSVDDKTFNEVLSRVKDCFLKVLDLSNAKINDDSNFIFDLGGSSLQYYELINEIAEATKTEFNLSSNNVFVTPLDFANVVVKNIKMEDVLI